MMVVVLCVSHTTLILTARTDDDDDDNESEYITSNLASSHGRTQIRHILTNIDLSDANTHHVQFPWNHFGWIAAVL